MSLQPVERRAFRPRAFDPRGEYEEFEGGGWNFMGSLAWCGRGLKSGLGRGGPHKGQFVVRTGS